MEKPSQLQQFLKESSSVGQTESAGEFTISRKTALEKISAFQLPFSQAWAVKIVQSAVAGGVDGPIRIDLSKTGARFYFQFDCKFSLDEIEDAFYNPEPVAERSLTHLISALWAVGVNDMRGFQIVLPRSSTALVWNGTELSRLDSESRYDCFYLEVSHKPQFSENKSWFKELVGKSEVNAEILRAVTRHCFTCPVPLTVDGMRADSLQLCPERGWSQGSLPLKLGFVESELPQFPVPSGTFDELASHTSKEWAYRGLERMGADFLEDLSTLESTSQACLLSAHFEEAYSEHDEWKLSLGYSQIYWVADGVVVDEDYLEREPRACSVATFLSADGLPTDLTGMRLLSGPQREQRGQLGRQNVASFLAVDETLRQKLVGAKIGKVVRVLNKATRYFGLGEIKGELVKTLAALGSRAYWSRERKVAEARNLRIVEQHIDRLRIDIKGGIL